MNDHINHVTLPPYSPSNNGQAERNVRLIKDLLFKNTQGFLRTRFSKVLIHVRTVPHSTTQIAPCVALNNRKYITLREHQSSVFSQ